MAQIKKIVRSNPVSRFTQVAPNAGGTFRLLADGMAEAYERVAPVAIDQMEEEGAARGRELARQQIGERPSFARDSADDPDFDWSRFAVGGAAARSDSFTGLQSGFRGRVQQLLTAAEEELGPGSLKITSAFRSNALQARLFDDAVARYGSEAAARKWVAPPGSSQHNKGEAVDFGDGNGGLLRDADSREARWLRENAGRFGLDVPMEWEPWQVEMAGSRGQSVVPSEEMDVQIRTSEGNVEMRRFSPYAGPILQAHDNAAKVAYQSEVLNAAAFDLLDISHRFEFDPDGFSQAAEGYVDQIVDGAPDEMQSTIRGALEKEVNKRTLGIQDARHRDIRQRANNQSAALVDRWSQNLTDAIASGDADEIADAEEQLDGLLQAREALPGLSWTPEQSGNVIIEARRRAEQQIEAARNEQAKQNRDTFNLITEAAKNGQIAADESLLSDPAAIASSPDEAREALAFTALRDNLPEFLTMKPSEQLAAVASMAAAPVESELQMDVVEAATRVVNDNVRAWNDDPVQQAFKVGQRSRFGPPPALPELNPAQPNDFVAGLTARRDYMNTLFDDGYTSTRAYLSEQEAQQISALMGRETPAEVRAAMAAAIVSGFGANAVTVFDEIDADGVTMFAGKMMAVGGNPQLAAKMLEGQAIIDEGLVQVPSKNARIEAYSAAISTALDGMPGRTQIERDILDAATALYAVDARGVEYTSEKAGEMMANALQQALGQTKNKRGETTGGVQEILGHQTLLPVGVSGARADRLLRLSLGGSAEVGGVGILGRITGAVEGLGEAIVGEPENQLAQIWEGLGGAPRINGKPIPRNLVDGGNVRIVPAINGLYRMEIVSGTTRLDGEDANGNIMFFDLNELLEAAG